MPKYTVQNPQGKKVTFQWDDPNPPTDADMEEVFSAAGAPSTPEPSAPSGASDTWGAPKAEIPSMSEALLPATTAARKSGGGLGRQALGLGSDALSGILRIPAAAGRTLDTKMGTSGDHPQGFRESLGQINRGENPLGKENFITGMVKDPATVAAAATAPITGPILGAARGVGLGGRLALKAGAGAVEGLASAAAHQGDKAARDGSVSLGSAAKEIGLNAALPVGLDLAATAGKKTLGGAGWLLKKHGEDIATNTIKPGLKDMKDGFRIANVYKHGLEGSLEQTAEKLDSKFTDLSRQLTEKIQASDAKVDMLDMLDDAATSVTGDKAAQFGKNSQMEKAADFMLTEINEIAPDGVVDLATAQKLKRAIGKMGAWEWGKTDPESSAREAMANALYSRLKKEIEDKAPEGVKEINRQLAELIPIERAVTRRIPIDARNSGLSLTDVIAGSSAAAGGMAAGGPAGVAAGLGGIALNKARKSPGLAAKGYRLGESMQRLRLPEAQTLNKLGRRVVSTGNFSETDEER